LGDHSLLFSTMASNAPGVRLGQERRFVVKIRGFILNLQTGSQRLYTPLAPTPASGLARRVQLEQADAMSQSTPADDVDAVAT
jgi:hypothetical protein